MDIFDHRQIGGLAVRRVANRLVRFFQTEANTMRVTGGWTPRTDDSMLRIKWARHLHEDARHADALFARLGRLRTTPEMIHVADARFREIFERANESESDSHLLGAIYLAIKPRLVEAYLKHLAETDAIGDELTARTLAPRVEELRAQILWGEQMTAALVGSDPARRSSVIKWARAVGDLVDAAGGFLLDSDEVAEERTDAEASCGTGFWKMRREPARRMPLGREFRIAGEGETPSHCPKYEEFGEPEKQLMLVHHGLMPEHASLAICGNLLYEFHDLPWEFYMDFATQAADEERHIMLLVKRLEELGGGPDSFPFPAWTFYDLLAGLSLGERLSVFNAIVEGDVVENLHERIRVMQRVGDARTAHIMDWICADESLHMLNGMRWLGFLYGETEGAIDAALDHGQGLLAEILHGVRTSEKSYDSAAEMPAEERKRVLAERRAAAAATFYRKRSLPVAPIARTLGGFSRSQIERLIELADGKTTRM